MWANEIYSVELPEKIRKNSSIVHFEMVNILVALNMWKDQWKHKFIKFYVDNQAVVTVCSSLYTRDSILATYVRNIWLLTSLYDIKNSVLHIPGKENCIADILSRWENSLAQKSKLYTMLPDHKWNTVPDSVFDVNTEI